MTEDTMGAVTVAHPPDEPDDAPAAGSLAPSGGLAPAEGYAALFAAHFRGMTQLAALLGADDPEDVAQEAFVRLHRSSARLRDPNASLAYLRATVCNLSRSRLRRLRTARSHQARLIEPSVAGVEHTAAVRQDHRDVFAAVQALPRRAREVVVMRYWLDMSEAQIADTLGVSAGAVKSYASRGLAAVSAHMKEQS